jgi:hypothetical protein
MRRLALCVVVLVACGHSNGSIDTTIGATCTANSHCQHTCYMGGDFPGGFCSSPCTSDNECSGDAVCAANGPGEGVCVFACAAFDCTRLGPQWGCHGVDAYGGGQVMACVGN